MEVQESNEGIEHLHKLLDEYEQRLTQIGEAIIDIRVQIAEHEGH